MLCCAVLCCAVMYCGMVWCGVRCGTVPCHAVPCGVWRGLMSRGVRCDAVGCSVMWCGVVWCAEGAVTKRQWPGWSCTRENASREGCVSKHALRVVCCAPVAEGRLSLWHRAATVHGCPGDTLPLCLVVLLEFSLPMRLQALVRQF